MFSLFERTVAFRYLGSARSKGFVSVIAGFSFVGIALGVATLIIVMSVMNGFRQELFGRITSVRGHVVVQGAEGQLNDYKRMQAGISKVPGVLRVGAIVDGQGVVMAGSQMRGVLIQGFSEADLLNKKIVSDNIRQGEIKDFTGNKLLIGAKLAERLRLNVGDSISIMVSEGAETMFGSFPKQRSFTVAGVFEVGMIEFDKTLVIMPIDTAQNIFKQGDTATQLEIYLDSAAKAPNFAYNLSASLNQTWPGKTKVVAWQYMDLQILHAVEVERNVMFIILTLIILIAAFNIISSLIMLVKDKTKDIAILRTMGASQGSLLRIFLLTGSTIGFVGTALGVLLGLGFALNLESIRQFLQKIMGTELFSSEIYFLSKLPSVVDRSEVMLIVLMSLTLSLLATVYPAWRAAKLDPVEGLKF